MSLGPSAIPGRRSEWVSPLTDGVAAEHQREWRRWFGAYDEVAVYSPSQSERSGFAVLLLVEGRARGFVKCRTGWDPTKETAIHEHVAPATTFQSPQPVGVHRSANWTSLGLTAMPGGLHSPILRGPVGDIASEVSELLRPVLDDPRPGWHPMHGDMGPWNLRQLSDERPYLFDWEHAAYAPPNADRVFHALSSQAMGLPGSPGLSSDAEALEYWVDEIPRRFGPEKRDARLAEEMMSVLARYR